LLHCHVAVRKNTGSLLARVSETGVVWNDRLLARQLLASGRYPIID
jgi:hypothetical protein